MLTPKQLLLSDFYLNDYFFDKIIIFILYKLYFPQMIQIIYKTNFVREIIILNICEIICVIIYIKNKFKSNIDYMNRTIWTVLKNCMTY